MRFVVPCVLLMIVPALHASDIEITANGACVAGSCPAAVIPANTNDSVSVNSTLTLANSDTYLIYGSFSASNGVDAFSTGHTFEVIYEGNASGSSSAADTITVDANYLLAGSGTDTFDRDVIGAFSSTIAPSSTASSCVNSTLGCTGVLKAPGSFSSTSSFDVTGSGGAFTFDPSFVNDFGAGSAVGSYIVWGQTAEIPAPTPSVAPEPGDAALLLAGLIAVGLYTNVGRFRRPTVAS